VQWLAGKGGYGKGFVVFGVSWGQQSVISCSGF